MSEVEKLITAIFGGVLALAIVSVILSQKSQTPQVLNAASGGLAQLIAAAVNPVQTSGSNGNLGNSSFTTPNISSLSNGLLSA